MNNKKLCRPNKFIGKEVKEFANLLSRITESNSNELGITFSQGKFLHFVDVMSREGPLYQKDLERELGIRPSSATEMLQKLEALSLIARRDDKRDRRIKIVELTDRGIEVEKAIFTKLCQLEETVTRGVSEEDLQVFFNVLDKLKTNLSELREEKK